MSARSLRNLPLTAVILCLVIGLVCSLNIIKRKDWGAVTPRHTTSLSTPVPLVVIHHTVTPLCRNEAACKQRVRNIQHGHMNDPNPKKRKSDIGYNFLVGGDGNVYEGRGWDHMGAHALGSNSRSIGIALIGNFQTQRPTNVMTNAIRDLIIKGIQQKKIKKNYDLRGHRQVPGASTLCPGRYLQIKLSVIEQLTKAK